MIKYIEDSTHVRPFPFAAPFFSTPLAVVYKIQALYCITKKVDYCDEITGEVDDIFMQILFVHAALEIQAQIRWVFYHSFVR